MNSQSRPSAEVKSLAIKHIRLLSTRAATLEAPIDVGIDLAVDWWRSDFRDYAILRRFPAASEAVLNTARQRVMNVGIDR